MAAADLDAGSGCDHGAGLGRLLMADAGAGDLHVEARSTGLLNDLADGQAVERGNAEALYVLQHDGLCSGLRAGRGWLGGGLLLRSGWLGGGCGGLTVDG